MTTMTPKKAKKAPAPPPPPEPPRVSTTVVDPLDLAVTVHEMDRARVSFVKLLRETAESLKDEAARIEREKLDASGNSLHRVSFSSLAEVIGGFESLERSREVLRSILGWAGTTKALMKLEEHEQVKAALAQYASPHRRM